MQVFIDGEFLGAGEIGLVTIHAEQIEPHSLAYFCYTCGEIWARIVVMNEDQDWRINNAYCPRHGLGTIWCSYDREHMRALPREALEREALLALENPKWYEYPQRRRGADGKMIPIRAQWDIDREAEEADDDIPIDEF